MVAAALAIVMASVMAVAMSTAMATALAMTKCFEQFWRPEELSPVLFKFLTNMTTQDGPFPKDGSSDTSVTVGASSSVIGATVATSSVVATSSRASSEPKTPHTPPNKKRKAATKAKAFPI